ncbi:MAG: M56 family metallopeptidase, partial [Planctomycetota bacterium]
MTNAINSIANGWFDWQLAMLWQTAILIGIIWVVDRCIRKWAHPQIRYALWLLILVKLILPPTVTSPASITDKIPGLALRAAIPIVSGERENVTEQNSTASVPPASSRQPLAVSTGVPVVEPATEVATGRERTETPENNTSDQISEVLASPEVGVQPAAATLTWKAWAMLTWLAGIAVLSTWLICRLSGLRRYHLKAGRPDLPDWFDDLLAATAKKLKLRRTPRVVLTDKVACPAVFGLFKPVLLIPASKLKQMTQQDTEHILLHELAHIKRGDLWVHAVTMTLQIVYWCNPLLWLARRPLQNLRELCCDATVARLLKDKTYQYRETLLETARQLLAEPVDPGLGLLGLFENNNWLITRLQWLEKNTWKNRPVRIVTIIALVAVMTTCVLPMGVFNPGPPNFVIKGTVTDAETGQPIVGAKVG